MSEVIDRAVELLRTRIAEIDEETTQLQRSLTNLSGDSNSTQRKAGRTPKRRRATKRAKKGQRLEEVSVILKSDPSAKTAEIARQIGISSNQVSALKAKLAKEQKKQTPRARSKRRAKKATPKAARSSKKTPAKSGTKKGAKKSSKGNAKASKASRAKASKK